MAGDHVVAIGEVTVAATTKEEATRVIKRRLKEQEGSTGWYFEGFQTRPYSIGSKGSPGRPGSQNLWRAEVILSSSG